MLVATFILSVRITLVAVSLANKGFSFVASAHCSTLYFPQIMTFVLLSSFARKMDVLLLKMTILSVYLHLKKSYYVET